ncbi:MAG: HPF/RaiA family ribosome-associated protein [Planctomycetota bacterium]
MRIDIVTRNIRREKPIRGFIQQKVEFALEKVNSNIEQVDVRLEDRTKKSNAFDGRCTIDVALKPGGTVHVSARAESAFECVVLAVRKMDQAIRNDLDRARNTSRGRQKKAQRAFLSELETTGDSVSTS